MNRDVRIGVDIGGTFTDVVVRRPGEPVRIMKLATTRADPSAAVLAALEHIAQEWRLPPEAVLRIVHGTTVATNAVLERKGARIGLITTAGFRDVIEIGRQMRTQMYDLALDPETPVFLCPGRLRREVRERIGPDGVVIKPLDEEALLAAADALAAEGVTAVAVVFLFSFLNDAHERRARELIAARHPALFVSLSSEVDPAFREYERTVVTAFDAYVKPIVDRYLDNLDRGLKAAGVGAPLQVMQSRGGVAGSQTARLRPVRLFLSGPAAGVVGGRMTAERAGFANVVTVDVGGTSSDIALIEDGRPGLRSEGLIDGYPVRTAMVDVNSIGAGGGSIAWLDSGNGLHVGPESAGSEPGPACYGRGGTRPTVTDASVVLGYLDCNRFAGGALKLDPELARSAIEAMIARPLGLSVEQAALGIHRIINAQMAEGIRLVSIRRGHDPRRFALLPLGGAGPLHGCALAEELGIGTIVVPRHPGVLSAAGLLAAPVEHEVSIAFPGDGADPDPAVARSLLSGLDRRAGALMHADGVSASDVAIVYFADVCYVGQAYELEVAYDPHAADPVATLTRDFYALHDQVYGHVPTAPIRIVNLRSVHRAEGLAGLDDGPWRADGKPPRRSTRILLPEQPGLVEAEVLDRSGLAAGDTFAGPAIIAQDDTTTLVAPGWSGRVDGHGNLILEQQARAVTA